MSCNSGKDLAQRCWEILQWQRTGILPGTALRKFAEKFDDSEGASLQLAEEETKRQALKAVVGLYLADAVK